MNGKQQVWKSGATSEAPDEDWLKRDAKAILIASALSCISGLALASIFVALVVSVLHM